MAAKSRTEHSLQNASTAFISRIVTIIAGYLTRVVFTRMLSADYLGVSGLFLDIMSLFSLTELGFSTAITFALYKPIAENDIEKQKSLMRLYRKFYRLVAGIVLTAGLALLPFLDVLIRDQPKVDHITLIYLMYLVNSVLSYLLIYKRTLIEAHQRMYVGVLSQSAFLILQYALQCVVLVTTRNFILYLTLYLICTLGNNLFLSHVANRSYPYLRDKDAAPLPQGEKKAIMRNIGSMLMHKLGGVAVNGTDNLLLSALVGTISVACYSNYYLLIGSVRQVLNQVFVGITASVGNLGVEQDRGHIRHVLETTFFIGQWLFGFAAICLYELLTPFVCISFGEQYAFSAPIVLILCVNFYITGLRQAPLVFHDSLGLFWHDRYKSIVEAVINLVVSIILGRRFGVIGIFIGTLISTMATSAWVEPLVIYRHGLRQAPWGYYGRYLLGCAAQAAVWLAADLLCRRVTGTVWVTLFGRGIICLTVPNLLFLLIYCRTPQLREVMGLARRVVRKILQR